MTAFSMPCWKKLRALVSALSIALVGFLPLSVSAEGLSVKKAELIMHDDAYFLRADFDVDFNKSLEEALEKGINLNFLVDLEITRPRWYWVDETIISARQNIRISYHALTRQYHVTSNNNSLSFNTLAEAKDELKHIAEWKVFERNVIKPGVSYQAALRMKLDIKQLPKPLQVEALGTKEWDLASEWFHFPLTP